MARTGFGGETKRQGPVGQPRKWCDNRMKTGLGENCERTQVGLTASWEQQVAGPCEHAKEFSG